MPPSLRSGSSLTIATVAAADDGDYTVDVIGTCGTELSAIATLTVLPLTGITTQPSTASVCAGPDHTGGDRRR